MATIFGIRLHKNRSDYRVLELDKGVFRLFLSFSGVEEGKPPACLKLVPQFSQTAYTTFVYPLFNNFCSVPILGHLLC